MELVELTPLRNALVGLPGTSGLSVEQRKRLTIAVELVANPSAVFMDEPTSGTLLLALACLQAVACTKHQLLHILNILPTSCNRGSMPARRRTLMGSICCRAGCAGSQHCDARRPQHCKRPDHRLHHPSALHRRLRGAVPPRMRVATRAEYTACSYA